MIQIVPSILSCDFSKLGEEIRAVEAAGADAIHIDVMDGQFVPNISIGIPIVKAVRRVTSLPLDCHLMIKTPEHMIKAFAAAGANWISVHAEACDLSTVLPAIRALGCRAGAVINPDTPAASLVPHLQHADYVLIMSVHPGFSGQPLIPECIDKVRLLVTQLQAQQRNIPIQIDGGITLQNVAHAAHAGASIIVAASAIFQSTDYRQAIAHLRERALR